MEHKVLGASVLSLLPLYSVHSTVYFATSAASANRIAAVAASPRAAACVAGDDERSSEFITSSSTGRETALANVRGTSSTSFAAGRRVTRLQIAGINRGFSPPGHPTRFTERQLMFTDGPAVVVLSDIGDPDPYSANSERRLLAILLSRVAANHPPD